MTILLASLSLAIAPVHAVRHCDKLFTQRMGERAALAIYRGDRKVSIDNLRLLGMIERCQRNPALQPVVRTFDRHQDALHKARTTRKSIVASLAYAEASWYNDAGNTASGFHAYYGVANRTLPFGTRVLFVYHGRSVTATVDDRGPYVGGRDWDLNQNTAAALAFGGVDLVGTHIE